MSTPEAIQFLMDDGAPIMVYVTILHAPMYTVKVPRRMLSTLNMWTLSNDYNFDLACVIFGFSVDLKYTPPMASCLLYVQLGFVFILCWCIQAVVSTCLCKQKVICLHSFLCFHNLDNL